MLPVMIAGHNLSEFCAKMQSYPEVGSCAVDAGVFQGANRSSLQLLHNRRGARYLKCKIDFFGRDNYARTRRQSEFEALFLSSDPVVIDLGDGFWYKAILIDIGDPATVSELITTVTYRFQVSRHKGAEVRTQLVPNDAHIFCQSNVAKTDCVIRILFNQLERASKLDIQLNGLLWTYSPVLTGDIVLDGVSKCFTVAGKNATNQIGWTDFPFLVPGTNTLNLSVNGVVVGSKSAEITYTPTFL